MELEGVKGTSTLLFCNPKAGTINPIFLHFSFESALPNYLPRIRIDGHKMRIKTKKI